MLELVASPKQVEFGLAKRDTLPRYCLDCDVRFACHGGCPKDRFIATPDGEPGLNYLCAGYKALLPPRRPADAASWASSWREGRAPVGDHAALRRRGRRARPQRSVQLRERQEVEALPRRLLALVRAVAGDYGRTSTAQFAAAISYRALFSLVPLATFVVTVAGLFLRDESQRQRFVEAVSQRFDLSASGLATVDRIVSGIPSPWSLLGLIALVVALWGATGVMTSVRKALAVIFDDGVNYGFAHGKLVDAALVVGVLLAMLVAVALSVLEQVAARASRHVERTLDWQPGGVGFVLGTLVPALLIAAVFALLYRYLPRHGPTWRAAVIAAAGAAVACQAIQYGLSWYLAGPADFTQLYGSAGAVLAFLLFVYLSAVAFLVGALTASRIGRWEPQ